MTNTYVSIDLETTGLNPKQDKITEIGALKIVDGKETERFSTFVNPGRKLDERIIELTGIRDEDLKDAPYVEEVLPELQAFLGDLPLLGHSVRFDFSFLKKAATDLKLTFDKEAVDTLKIARKYLAELEHRNLDFLCKYYGIEHQAHRALEDARATHLLYGKLAEQFYEKECEETKDKGERNLFVPAPLVFQVKRDTPATKAQKEQIYRLAERHKIVLQVDVGRLRRSEASRLYDKMRGEIALKAQKACAE